MKNTPIVLLVLLALFFGKAQAQNVTEKNEFHKVLPGYSEVNVREIVGVPARVEPFVTIHNTTNDTTTFWVYNNLYTIAFKNHFVDYVEPDRVLFLQKVQNWANPQNKEGVRIKYGK